MSNQVEIIYSSGRNSKDTGEIIRISPRKSARGIRPLEVSTGLKITGDRSPVKMTGQLDVSSVKICFLSVTDTLTLTVKQTIRNLFRYIIVSCFNSRRRQSHWKA